MLINAVGYMGKDTPASGNCLLTAMFDNVAKGGKFKLSDIKVNGYSTDPGEEGWGAYGEVFLTILNSTGGDLYFTADEYEGKYTGLKKQFFWYHNEDNEAGWYDTNGEILFDGDAIEFTAGDAFWVGGSSSGQTVVFSGAVGKSQITIATSASGCRLMGNPFAVNLKLKNVFATGFSTDTAEEGWGAYGETYLTILNSTGGDSYFTEAEYAGKYVGMKKQFFWYENEDTAGGWYDTNGEIPFDGDLIEFDPGQGLWVGGSSSGQSVVFQPPEVLK